LDKIKSVKKFLYENHLFIRAEGFNTPPLVALILVLNPECNTLLEQHTQLFAAGMFILWLKKSKYTHMVTIKKELSKRTALCKSLESFT